MGVIREERLSAPVEDYLAGEGVGPPHFVVDDVD
jgi:hypothetical protein